MQKIERRRKGILLSLPVCRSHSGTIRRRNILLRHARSAGWCVLDIHTNFFLDNNGDYGATTHSTDWPWRRVVPFFLTHTSAGSAAVAVSVFGRRNIRAPIRPVVFQTLASKAGVCVRVCAFWPSMENDRHNNPINGQNAGDDDGSEG